MRKILVFSLLSFLIFISCAESKAVVESGKIIRGDWVVTNVSVEGIDSKHIEAKVFDQASFLCYLGSEWHLVQNNASGHYTLNAPAASCPRETTNIKWFITEMSGYTEFKFKKIYPGEKPKNVADGYSLRVINLSKETFTLGQDLMFEGKPIRILYTFSK